MIVEIFLKYLFVIYYPLINYTEPEWFIEDKNDGVVWVTDNHEIAKNTQLGYYCGNQSQPFNPYKYNKTVVVEL
jgi:hypothetical protein